MDKIEASNKYRDEIDTIKAKVSSSWDDYVLIADIARRQYERLADGYKSEMETIQENRKIANNGIKQMTIQDLNKIIIDNFSDDKGDVCISGLEFKHSLTIKNLIIGGNLDQGNQKVEGNLDQGNQLVEDGDIYQGKQIVVNGDIDQSNQKVNGYIAQCHQKVKGDIFQNKQIIEGDLYQGHQVVTGEIVQKNLYCYKVYN